MNQSEEIYDIISDYDKEHEILEKLNQTIHDPNGKWKCYDDCDIFLTQCFYDAIDRGWLNVFAFLCKNVEDKRKPCSSWLYEYALFDGDDYAKKVLDIATKFYF